MCLLAVLFHCHPDAPLIVAANRDEFLARPATAMTVLRKEAPRTLGGRDERAGGTWLAVNRSGVFAALTNRPGGTVPGRRSRGELPLLLTESPDAGSAVREFTAGVTPADYSACWLFAGDARSLHYIDLTGESGVNTRKLGAGIHVLENEPLEGDSPKARFVRERLAEAGEHTGEGLRRFLHELLSTHEIPGGTGRAASGRMRPAETFAPCVHAGPYGTRSSEILLIDGQSEPQLWYMDGPPCKSELREASRLWQAGA